MEREILFLSFAAIAAWQDFRNRQVSLLLFLIFAVAALPFCVADPAGCLPGIIPGLVLLLISRLTAGAVGFGDGLFFIVSGLYLGAFGNFTLLFASFFLGGIFSLAVFVIQRIKNNRYAGKETLPFLPFAAAAALFFVVMDL